jgi:hypothetical protein
MGWKCEWLLRVDNWTENQINPKKEEQRNNHRIKKKRIDNCSTVFQVRTASFRYRLVVATRESLGETRDCARTHKVRV